MGHLPVDRPFQRIFDYLEYRTVSVSPTRYSCTWVLTVMVYLMRFAVLISLPNKQELAVAKVLVERVFGIFGPPETPLSDMGFEFENKVIRQLQE